MKQNPAAFNQIALLSGGKGKRSYFNEKARKARLLGFLFISFHFSDATAQTRLARDSAGSEHLFQTIRSGDAAGLEAMLKGGANVNATRNGYSALMAATLNGTLEEMTLLINHGANVNYFSQDGISAIWLAVPDTDKTMLLINKGANVQQRSREGNTVLVKLAAVPGTADLMKLLIGKGCDPRKAGRANDIMYNAATTDDTAMVGLLIRNDVSVNDTSSLGDYPLNSATNYRCFNSLKMMVDNGADVNVSPKQSPLLLTIGITPLMWAAVSNDKPSFYYLLQHGADAKAKSPGGYTTLMFFSHVRSRRSRHDAGLNRTRRIAIRQSLGRNRCGLPRTVTRCYQVR